MHLNLADTARVTGVKVRCTSQAEQLPTRGGKVDTQTSFKPAWWILLVFVGLVLGLLVLAHRLMPSLGWREFADISILIFAYGLIELWLRKSSSSLVEDHPDPAKNVDYDQTYAIEELPLKINPRFHELHRN
jgi:hypothetical protein